MHKIVFRVQIFLGFSFVSPSYDILRHRKDFNLHISLHGYMATWICSHCDDWCFTIHGDVWSFVSNWSSKGTSCNKTKCLDGIFWFVHEDNVVSQFLKIPTYQYIKTHFQTQKMVKWNIPSLQEQPVCLKNLPRWNDIISKHQKWLKKTTVSEQHTWKNYRDEMTSFPNTKNG